MLASVPVQCPCHVDPLRQPGNLLWGTYELGQATVYRRPGRRPHFLRRWLVCPHIAPGSQVPPGSVDNHNGTRTCVWHRCPKTYHFSSGRESCRAYLDSELYNSDRKANSDDGMEGPASSNANDESSRWLLINVVGLFTYPILPAADILAYS